MGYPFDYISTRPRGVLMIYQALPGQESRINERRQETMSVQVTPLHDRVLIKRIEEKESVKGGIIIPDTAKEKPQEGEVIAVGAGKIEKGKRIPLDVKPGDRILFGKYTGNDITLEGQEYLILR